jgi:hypothetical protein
MMEWLDWARGRLRCRLLRRHGAGCRGRTDHTAPGIPVIDPGRWDMK